MNKAHSKARGIASKCSRSSFSFSLNSISNLRSSFIYSNSDSVSNSNSDSIFNSSPTSNSSFTSNPNPTSNSSFTSNSNPTSNSSFTSNCNPTSNSSFTSNCNPTSNPSFTSSSSHTSSFTNNKIDLTNKVCNRCGVAKQITSFDKKKAICKECNSIKVRCEYCSSIISFSGIKGHIKSS